MIKIAIVDDEEYSAVKCRRIINSTNIRDLQVDIFDDSKNFCEVLFEHKEPFDIIILDIDMPDISGFDIAKRIRDENLNSIIMFYTAHDQYVFKSFEFQPFRYIRKTATEEELPFALECAVNRIQSINNNIIHLSYKGIDYILAEKDIICAEKSKHMIAIHMFDKKVIDIRMTMDDFLKLLHNNDFVLVNQGTIINMIHIEKIENSTIIMTNNIIISISKRKYKEFKTKFSKYIGDMV